MRRAVELVVMSARRATRCSIAIRMPTELIHYFFCKQTYWAEVEYDKEMGIFLPHVESQLECPNEGCPSNAADWIAEVNDEPTQATSAAQPKSGAAD
jgi:hypothetical protein